MIAVGACRERTGELDRAAEVPDGLEIRGASARELARLLTIRDRLAQVASLLVVMRQHLELRRELVCELRLEDLGDARVVLPSGSAQQRLVGRVLDQGVLEGVSGAGGDAALVEELCAPQLLERRSESLRFER